MHIPIARVHFHDDGFTQGGVAVGGIDVALAYMERVGRDTRLEYIAHIMFKEPQTHSA